MMSQQDARYAPGYFPLSLESGNRNFTSCLIKLNLRRMERQNSDLGQFFRTSELRIKGQKYKACSGKWERLFSKLCFLLCETQY